MKVDYRGHARQALQWAQQELQSDDDVRLRSAALQLRMAMEALTYDRFQVYADEVPPESYATWQPKRVMQLLLEIDAGADTESSLAVGLEETYDVPAGVMTGLGTEKVLSLAAIKKHYDALGSYLHMPTWKQMQDGKPLNATKLKARCLQIAADLEKIFASPVWNIRFAVMSRTDCIYCGRPMHKRCPKDGDSAEVKCFECGAFYRLTLVGDHQVRWEPLQTKVSCLTEGCDHTFILGNHEIKRGTNWSCPKCSQRYKIDYAVISDTSLLR